MSQAEALASHWVLLFFLGLLNKYMLAWSIDYAPVERPSSRQDYIQRTWSEWTEWSACSRTCGGGVKMRTRVCKMSTGYRATIFPNSCIGETFEYELCSVHNCSPYDKEFLEYQCSLRDGQIIRGTKVEEWIPYRYGKNPCELQCWSKDRTVVHSFGKAIDGTKCATPDPRQPALCVNGRCTPVDCAGQIGSDNKLDKCGVCRGNNSTCIHYRDIFWGRPRTRTHFDGVKDHHYDYEKITAIPAGAAEIIIRESSETNFLALLDHNGNYLVNGNWRIQSPGRITIHGSEFTYNRTWDGRESITTEGPIRYDVFVYVLGSGDIPTVNFEYWISTNNPYKSAQPFPVLNQIKQPEISEMKNTGSKYLHPENNHIHDGPPKKPFPPTTQFQGYKSYYHRNEILKSVPSWSIKRHRTHKNNVSGYLNAQNDISSSTTKNSAEVLTRTPPFAQVETTSESQNKVDSRIGLLDRRKSLLAHNKTNILRTNTRIRPSEDDEGISFHDKGSTLKNSTTASFNYFKKDNKRHRYNANEIAPVRRKKFQNYEESPDGYGKFTTARAQTKSNDNYRRDFFVTLQPNMTFKDTESHGRRRSGTKKQNSQKNGKKLDDAKQKHFKKRRKAGNEECQPCSKSKQQKKSFCTNDFVLKAIVLSVEKQEDSFRYEVEINQSFKNRVPISPREYIWTTEPCRCPKMHIGNEYIIMGHSGTSGNRRESRLQVNKNSFVRRISAKRTRTLQRLVRDQSRICRKYE